MQHSLEVINVFFSHAYEGVLHVEADMDAHWLVLVFTCHLALLVGEVVVSVASTAVVVESPALTNDSVIVPPADGIVLTFVPLVCWQQAPVFIWFVLHTDRFESTKFVIAWYSGGVTHFMGCTPVALTNSFLAFTNVTAMDVFPESKDT